MKFYPYEKGGQSFSCVEAGGGGDKMFLDYFNIGA